MFTKNIVSGAFRSLHCLIYKVLARPPQRRNVLYLTTSFCFCQALFQLFRSFFGACLGFPPLSQTAHQAYQSSQSLSSTFFTSLKSFLLSRWHDRRVSDSLLTIPDLSPFVNTFFQLFASFLFSSPQHTSQLLPLSSFLFIPLCHWARNAWFSAPFTVHIVYLSYILLLLLRVSYL